MKNAITITRPRATSLLLTIALAVLAVIAIGGCMVGSEDQALSAEAEQQLIELKQATSTCAEQVGTADEALESCVSDALAPDAAQDRAAEDPDPAPLMPCEFIGCEGFNCCKTCMGDNGQICTICTLSGGGCA